MPSWKELRRYCEKNGWDLYKKTDHFYYRKVNKDGTIWYTKASNGNKQIGEKLWHEILKRQLHITKEEFERDK